MNTQRMNSLIDAAVVINDEPGLKRALRDNARKWGYDYFVYLLLAGKSSFAYSSYPVEWQKLYFEQHYEHVDPIIKVARSTMKLFSWSTRNLGRNASRPQADFLDHAFKFGIASGVSIPITAGFGKIALLTFASGREKDDIDTTDPIRATIAATLIHSQITFMRTKPTAVTMPKLSRQQAICLRWSSEGKSMDAIAEIMGITAQSVRFHLDEARSRLDAVNLIQASTIATRHHLL